jgi:hypothetical protein
MLLLLLLGSIGCSCLLLHRPLQLLLYLHLLELGRRQELLLLLLRLQEGPFHKGHLLQEWVRPCKPHHQLLLHCLLLLHASWCLLERGCSSI